MVNRDLSEEVKTYYVAMRQLPDGRWLGVHRLMFHWTLHVDVSEMGYEDRYCYDHLLVAIEAMNAWDGTGDPIGWKKHPSTGRTRIEADPAKEGESIPPDK